MKIKHSPNLWWNYLLIKKKQKQLFKFSNFTGTSFETKYLLRGLNANILRTQSFFSNFNENMGIPLKTCVVSRVFSRFITTIHQKYCAYKFSYENKIFSIFVHPKNSLSRINYINSIPPPPPPGISSLPHYKNVFSFPACTFYSYAKKTLLCCCT